MHLIKWTYQSYKQILCILSWLLVSACSYQYIDDKGYRHVIGITHVVTGTELSDAGHLIEAQQVSTFGVSVLRLPEAGGLTVGYERNFSLIVYGDTAALLSLDPVDITTVRFCPIPWKLKELEDNATFAIKE